MKRIINLVSLFLFLIAFMYGLLLLLKQFGITGGGLTQLIPFGTMLFLVFVYSRFVCKYSMKDLGIIYLENTMGMSILFLVFALLPLFFEVVFHGSMETKGNTDSTIFFSFFYLALVAFSEEILFRGYMGKVLAPSSFWTKSLISAVLFAGMHFISPEFSLALFVVYAVFGIVFMAMYHYTQSLWPLIVFHWAWNMLAGHFAIYSNVLIDLSALALSLLILSLWSRRRSTRQITSQSI